MGEKGYCLEPKNDQESPWRPITVSPRVPHNVSLTEANCYSVAMSHPKEKEVADRLIPIISDAFNRSISALEDAGAIDTRKLQKHHRGVGTKYYDIVSEQIYLTIKSGAPWICEIFDQ
jgi:hypothetical protein